ncbi:anaerobic ribonucleoside-triphosphate reductase-like protein [Flavobacterium sp. 103]|nr:anaerobic ribonucleoside-triphosphate reductase-like protein [Flavobacterium sp. 103]
MLFKTALNFKQFKPLNNIKLLNNHKKMKLTTNQILEQNQELRTKCLVYTRVMGYHRPVESFNIGKKGEHRQRTHFTEGKCC